MRSPPDPEASVRRARPRAALASILLATVSSCANYTRPLGSKDRPTATEAIIYGRFQVSAPFAFLALSAHDTMGFVMKCADGREYRIRFDDVRPLVVLSVAPSRCSVVELLFTDANGGVVGRTSFPNGLLENMGFEAGNAYYLGDYRASIADEFGVGIRRVFKVEGARDDFAGTTRDLKAAFPHVARAPTVNQLSLGARPVEGGGDTWPEP